MNKKTTPKGPSYLSFMAEMVPDILNYFFELMEDYGDIVKIPALKTTYMINNADMVKYVLKDNSENFIRSSSALEQALGKGLYTIHCSRKSFAPVFQPKNIRNFVPLVQDETKLKLDKWETAFLNSKNSFDITSEVMSIVFRIALTAFYEETIDEHLLNKILKSIVIENRHSTSKLASIPWFPSVGNIRYQYARRFLKHYLYSIITRAKLKPSNDSLIQIILRTKKPDNQPFSEKDLLDVVTTFLMTGHETSGAAIIWTLKLLAEHPKVQKKLKKELKQVLQGRPPTYEDLANLTYTKAVFEEAIRLYPPIWSTARICQKDDWLGEYFIKKGSYIVVCPFTIHRRKCYWERPLEFIPERHLSSFKNKPPMFAFIPFGGGPHICIASHFGTMECMIIVAMIMQRFSLHLDLQCPIELEPLISLRPKFGVKAYLTNSEEISPA